MGKHDPATDPMDVAQEVLAVMSKQTKDQDKPKYKTVALGHFWPWVFTIVRYKIGNLLRKPGKEDSLEKVHLDLRPSDEDPERVLWEKELKRIVLKMMSEMPEKDRKTLRALIMKSQGFDLPEELASLPKEVWHPRVSRCRRKFRELLKKKGLI